MIPNYFAVLGLSVEADEASIRAVLRSRRKQVHPDHATDEADRLAREAATRELADAEHVLLDAGLRYDLREQLRREAEAQAQAQAAQYPGQAGYIEPAHPAYAPVGYGHEPPPYVPPAPGLPLPWRDAVAVAAVALILGIVVWPAQPVLMIPLMPALALVWRLRGWTPGTTQVVGVTAGAFALGGLWRELVQDPPIRFVVSSWPTIEGIAWGALLGLGLLRLLARFGVVGGGALSTPPPAAAAGYLGARHQRALARGLRRDARRSAKRGRRRR